MSKGGGSSMQRMSEGTVRHQRPRVGFMGRSADVVVVGAGVVGASCAYYLARPASASGSTTARSSPPGAPASCEGNVLAWDKELERELPLALRSADLWQGLARRARRRLRVRPQGQRRGRRDRGRAAGLRRAQPRAGGPGRRGRGARRRRAAPRGALRGARPAGRRALSRRRAAGAAPGDRRAGPRRGRPRGRAVHRRRRHGDRCAAPTGAPRASRRAPAASARTWSWSPRACGRRRCSRPPG